MGAKFLFSIISHSEEETLSLGEKLAAGLKGGDVLCLEGELGAGKTTLVRGILSGFGWKDMVKSPSFVLLIPYETTPPVVHADLYRLGAADVEGTGLMDYFDGERVIIVEWSDRLDKSVLDDCLVIEIKITGEDRTLNFYANGYHFETLAV